MNTTTEPPSEQGDAVEPANVITVIGFTKFVFDVLWIGAIVFFAGAIILWIVFSNIAGAPLCGAAITLDPEALNYEITLPMSDTPLEINTSDTLPVPGHHAYILIRSPNVAYSILYLGIAPLAFGLFLGILYLLRRFFGALKKEPPFTLKNAARLRTIGLLLFWGSAAGSLIEFFMQHYLNSLVTTEGVRIRLGFYPPYESLIVGLVLLAIAAAFRKGAMLKEENASAA